MDDEGNSIGSVEETFNINCVFYVYTTHSSGHAKLKINLNSRTYIITAQYKNCAVSNNITILPKLSTNDLNKTYGAGNQFAVHLVDSQRNVVTGVNITFKINSVSYKSYNRY